MTPSKPIVVVDPDPEWRQRIVDGLASPHVDAVGLGSGRSAFEHVRQEKPALVVTEMVLPEISGLGLCRLVREDPALRDTGLLMVSSLVSEIDRVLAYEAGVDDFLAKPFFARELGSRVGAILRRSWRTRDLEPAPARPGAGRVAIHTDGSSVLVDGRRVELTPRELNVLVALLRQSGRVLTRRQLVEKVWGAEADPGGRVIDAHVKSIRKKLGDAKECLETVRGVGYRFSERAAD